MKLFLDASVLLAACGSETGSSRALFNYADMQGWALQSSPYAVDEVARNLRKLPTSATVKWAELRPQLKMANDVLTIDRPVVFPVAKDRPILFAALAWSEILLTLDKEDFADLLGRSFYGLEILLPYEFLERERATGRLII